MRLQEELRSAYLPTYHLNGTNTAAHTVFEQAYGPVDSDDHGREFRRVQQYVGPWTCNTQKSSLLSPSLMGCGSSPACSRRMMFTSKPSWVTAVYFWLWRMRKVESTSAGG